MKYQKVRDVADLLKYHCAICGQRITDASGCWRFRLDDHGIGCQPSVYLTICSWCRDGVMEKLNELSMERKHERSMWDV